MLCAPISVRAPDHCAAPNHGECADLGAGIDPRGVDARRGIDARHQRMSRVQQRRNARKGRVRIAMHQSRGGTFCRQFGIHHDRPQSGGAQRIAIGSIGHEAQRLGATGKGGHRCDSRSRGHLRNSQPNRTASSPSDQVTAAAGAPAMRFSSGFVGGFGAAAGAAAGAAPARRLCSAGQDACW